MRKVILHLCADLGSDSYFYQQDKNYKVVLIGEKIGVENYEPTGKIHGIIANPVCTEFSTAKGFHKENNIEKGMFLYSHCMRIIKECTSEWWVLENPFNGVLKEVIGKPDAIYQPWQYGSPWTKNTALWGSFNMPAPIFNKWQDVPKIKELYTRPGRGKPSLAFLHKSAINHITEFEQFKPYIKCDADFRSLCSQGFAKAFYEVNQ
jgi:hypothetical protein